MVDNCDELIAIWNGTAGGTKNTVDYAKKSSDRKIIQLKPEEYI